jgi:hypothetical protein
MPSQNLPTRTLAGVLVPATELVDKAIELAKKYMDPIGYRHVMRSWLIGALIISRLPVAQRHAIDVEAYAIATILHDLGWSHDPKMRSEDKVFEVDGANAAREFLLREGDPAQWDKHRIQLVWDAIALHTYPSVAAHKEPEVALTNTGISVELLGVEFGKQRARENIVQVSEAEMDRISAEFPRAGLREHIKELMCGYCIEKPEVTYLSWVSQFGNRFVEGYSTEGKQLVDLMMANITE